MSLFNWQHTLKLPGIGTVGNNSPKASDLYVKLSIM